MKYQIMFYGGIVGTIIMLVITIIVFIKYDIIQVINDLLGVRSRKERYIKKETNKNTTDIVKKSTTRDIKLKKIAEEIKLKESGIIDGIESKETESIASYHEETEFINDDVEETEVIESIYTKEEISTDENETMLLENEDETMLLENEDETTILTEFIENKDNENFIKEVDIMVVNSNFTI